VLKAKSYFLTRRVFYPTDGDQEHDTGWLQQGNTYVVVLKKEQGTIVHFVKGTAELPFDLILTGSVEGLMRVIIQCFKGISIY
jgi:Ser-tRNA(Ala) deacylase AlaX